MTGSHKTCRQCGPYLDTGSGCPMCLPLPDYRARPQQGVEAASVIDEVIAERQRQDEKWGGPEHDDQHVPDDWASFISIRAEDISSNWRSSRQYLLEIAALAVAAIESADRKAQQEQEDG